MERLRKICKLCGKEYEACFTPRVPGDGDRWQDVACCPEHGAEYIATVIAARLAAKGSVADETKDKITEEVDDVKVVEPQKKVARKKRDTDDN